MARQAIIILLWQVTLGAACQRTNPARNQIIFQDSTKSVQDAVAALRPLMKKLEYAPSRMNFFTDHEGYVYLNSQRIAKESLLDEPEKLAELPAFAPLSLLEIKRFVSLRTYLHRNHMESFGISYGNRYIFYYYETDNYDDSRKIMLVTNSKDTTNAIFKSRYQTLDRKEDLILLAPIDAKIR